jgi:hypothetical protein
MFRSVDRASPERYAKDLIAELNRAFRRESFDSKVGYSITSWIQQYAAKARGQPTVVIPSTAT